MHDGESGVVIDPQRNLDRVEHAVAQAGERVVLALETYVHNDDVSGGPDLARRSGADSVLPGGERVDFTHPGRRRSRLSAGT